MKKIIIITTIIKAKKHYSHYFKPKKIHTTDTTKASTYWGWHFSIIIKIKNNKGPYYPTNSFPSCMNINFLRNHTMTVI
jgi:hypothetical protein